MGKNSTGGQYNGKSKISSKSGYAKQSASNSARPKSVAGGGLSTGGLKGWSGASGSAGGTGGKTFGGAPKVSRAGSTGGGVKAPAMTGHTAGKHMPGNMMGHSDKTTPFTNTGMQPAGAKILDVSLASLKSSNAHNPGASNLDAKYKAKLEASHGHPMPGSWTGGSATAGGTSAKTYGLRGLKK